MILNILEELEELGINIISLSEGLNSNYQAGKMMIQMLSIVSNWELMSIRERVKTGVENARKRGERLGRPPITKSQKNKLIRLYQLNQYTVKDTAKICGMEVSTAYKYLKQANIQRRR